VDEEIRQIVNTSTFKSQTSQLFCQSIPAKDLAEICICDLQRAQVLEDIDRYSAVEWELLVASNAPYAMIEGQLQAGNLGECGVEISQVF